jgi:hypothetical protein
VFYYYGRKGRAASTYPAPEYSVVIEPFAGSMAYSLHWQPPSAMGIERDSKVHALWHRLVNMSAEEIETFPAPVLGKRAIDPWYLQAVSSKDKLSVRYRTVNEFMIVHFERQRRLALKRLDYARTVLYALGDYRQAPDIEATWFIDPPYQDVKGGIGTGTSTTTSWPSGALPAVARSSSAKVGAPPGCPSDTTAPSRALPLSSRHRGHAWWSGC